MAARITTAFVLAAGLGTRMRPLTDDRPKPMVILAGRPLIDHVLDRLAEAGVERAVVNVHYKAGVLTRHLRRRTGRPGIVISDERDQLLDTGGGVARALPLLGDDPFIIHNSDSVWSEGVGRNLDRLIAAWNEETMDALLLLARTTASIGYDGRGDFSMDVHGRLSRRSAHQVVPFAFSGVSIAHPRLLADAPDGAFSLNRSWDQAMARGRLHGITLDGTWMHVGDPAALAEADALMAEHA